LRRRRRARSRCASPIGRASSISRAASIRAARPARARVRVASSALPVPVPVEVSPRVARRAPFLLLLAFGAGLDAREDRRPACANALSVIVGDEAERGVSERDQGSALDLS